MRLRPLEPDRGVHHRRVFPEPVADFPGELLRGVGALSEAAVDRAVAEGERLAVRVGHPSVKLLADFYHMRLESEDMNTIIHAGSMLRHAHIANSDGRKYPRERSEDRYDDFFAALEAIGYQGMLSAEPMSGDLASEAPASLALLRQLAAEHSL